MSKNSITIITICLNAEETIDCTIQSVLNQTVQVDEYIIIDGKSSDRTLEICFSYNEFFKERKINYIIESGVDNGISDAFNKGISIATGNLIGIINSDDSYQLNTIELIKKYNNKYGLKIYFGDLNYIGSRIQKGDPEFFRLIKFVMPRLNHPTCFIPKEYYMKYGLYDIKYNIAMDYELLKRMFKNGANFYYIPMILSNMSLGGISTTHYDIRNQETMQISDNRIITRFLLIYNSIKRNFNAIKAK
ncbi:MAG: glycosyltransferase family 2 protein [Bacteroidales bacterium]|nr:glycosyltransferase family 2 protein [Bacteroidales bacterium]